MDAKKLLDELSPDELLKFYSQMMLIRIFEEKTNEMYHRGHIGGYCHLYIGQEAVAVGAINALRPDDYVIGAYRDHGHAILKGSDPKHVMAELFGKKDGVSKGKGGSMHMFNRENRFMGGDGIVAGELPVAAGLAFAVEYNGGDEIVFCFFGEGAVNEGAFHEAMNIASLWRLPVVFLCENNEWGMGTHVAKASVSIDIVERACGYRMRLERGDGMDVLAVYDITRRAVDYSRQTRRPAFIEVLTQRFVGHSVTDPQLYRTREEVEKLKKYDPITNFGKLLVERGINTQDDLDEVERNALAEVEQAVDFAMQSPFPGPEELCTDLWDTTEFAEPCKI